MNQFVKHHWVNIVALLLTLPAVYFILACILKFGLGIYRPFDGIAPLLERTGMNESLWRNINLLILAGPMIAFVLSLFSLLRIRTQFTRHHFLLQMMLKKKWFALFVAGVSITLLTMIFLYLACENPIHSQ